MGKQFLIDVLELRRRAREHMKKGPVTKAYGADRETVIKILNDSLATELVCTLRYRAHYYLARGIHSDEVAAEFKEHADQELEHTEWIAERIRELGGVPNFNPLGILDRSHSEYVEGDSLVSMMEEDLVAERIAVAAYTEIIRYLGDSDPTTRKLFEDILEVEEEHAEDLVRLLEREQVAKAA
jgi:bacterioferritin